MGEYERMKLVIAAVQAALKVLLNTADIGLHAVCVESSKWFPTIHATLETLLRLYRCTGFPMDSGCVCVYGMCMPCV